MFVKVRNKEHRPTAILKPSGERLEGCRTTTSKTYKPSPEDAGSGPDACTV